MTAIRLYLDEDCMNRALLGALRQRDIDVMTVSEADNDGLSDLEQLAWASENHRAICTYNVRDFQILHHQYLSEGISHWGIIFMKQNLSIGQRLYGLSALVGSMTSAMVKNQTIFLSKFIK